MLSGILISKIESILIYFLKVQQFENM